MVYNTAACWHNGSRDWKTRPRQTKVEDIHKRTAVACICIIKEMTMIMLGPNSTDIRA